MDSFDHFLFDLDGVVYLGNRPVPGAPEALAAIREAGKSLLFLTNSPRASAAEVAARLQGMGVATRVDEVLTSSMALARHLSAHYDLAGKPAYVVGSGALREDVAGTGLRLVDGDEALRAEFVVVGVHDGFTYQEMKLATLAVRAGAHFFGTNRDACVPTHEGMVPGSGAIIASIEVASGRQAIVAGKPEPMLVDAARAILGSHGRYVMVGDRLDTDVSAGLRAGIATILVLTGAATREDLATSTVQPDYVLEGLKGLL